MLQHRRTMLPLILTMVATPSFLIWVQEAQDNVRAVCFCACWDAAHVTECAYACVSGRQQTTRPSTLMMQAQHQG
mgnify:FL=1